MIKSVDRCLLRIFLLFLPLFFFLSIPYELKFRLIDGSLGGEKGPRRCNRDLNSIDTWLSRNVKERQISDVETTNSACIIQDVY